MDHLVTGVYNLAVVAGCAYVVFGLGHSGWWFVVAAIFLCSSGRRNTDG